MAHDTSSALPKTGRFSRFRSAQEKRPARTLASGRTLSILSGVVLVAFNVALAVTLYNDRQQMLTSAEATVVSLRQAVREQVEATVSRVNIVLANTDEVLALRPDGRVRGAPEVRAFLERETALLPMVRALIVTDRDGMLLHDSQVSTPAVLDLSDRDYFRAHVGEGPATLFIGRPVLGRTSGTWFISISRRLSDVGGRFAGVVTAVVDPAALDEIYTGFKLENEGAISVMRADGMLLLRTPEYERFIGTDQSGSRLFKAILAGATEGSDASADGIDGRRRLMAWSKVGMWPVIVSVSVSRDAVLREWWNSVPLYIGVMGAVSALILVLVARVRRQLQTLNHVVADLSARKSELLAATQASDLANRAKTQFLANMSHELRTPLNAIIGFSDMLIGGVHGPLVARQKEYARDIHLSAMHLLDLINDILDVAKIESGTYDLHEQPVNIAEVIAACERMLRGRAREKNLQVDTLFLDEQSWVRADERAIRQIILNLLSNAVKFTQEGGQITVTVGQEANGGLVLMVADTGIGIPPEHLDLVLRPFHQVDAADTRRHEGTGLGLPLAKALVEKHGGTLRLDSKVGQGTRVMISLPTERVLSLPPPLGLSQG
ncbi:sensor histidine kinase [Pararhodospirillum photometricum]|nr:ATP-binding protein [Pararhodospirillum photometricum]